MRCTSCGQEIKPVVAIDIDGTLGDYHGHFLRFLEAYFYLDEQGWTYDGSNKFSRWCMSVYGVTLEQYRQAKLAYRQGGMKRTMPIFTGAQALCWVARDSGAELWLTTTRPYLSLDGVVPDTIAWLKHHEIEYDGLLFDDDKYTKLADRIDSERVVAVLDDQGDMINSAAILFGLETPILVRTQWNAALRAIIMADLDACADILKRRIEVWRIDNAT